MQLKLLKIDIHVDTLEKFLNSFETPHRYFQMILFF